MTGPAYRRPDVGTRLDELLDERGRYPSDALVWTRDGWTDQRRLLDDVDLHYDRMAMRGVGAGHRVALTASNSVQTVAAMFAVWRLDATAVMLPAALPSEARRRIIEAAEPVTEYDQTNESTAAAQPAPEVGGAARPNPRPSRPAERASDGRYPALILPTSGSTGHPKLAVLSHTMAIYYSSVFVDGMGYRSDDVLYTCMPLNHVHALFTSLVPALLCGGGVALAPRFSASRFWTDVAESEASVFGLMGPMPGILMAQAPTPLERSHRVRLVQMVPPISRLSEFKVRFRIPTVVSQLYGMTEAMVIPPDPDAPNVKNRLGPAPEDWEIRIERPPARSATVGELQVRPRSVWQRFEGYLVDGAVQRIAAEDWFATGDLADVDREGCYTLRGRVANTIRTKGESVIPEEVEEALLSHPTVREAVVTGRPGPFEDTEVVAVVTVEGSTTPGDLSAHASQILPSYMVPAEVIRAPEMPQLPNGKIDRVAVTRIAVEASRDTPADAIGGPDGPR